MNTILKMKILKMKWITIFLLLITTVIAGYCQSPAQSNALTRFECSDGICITNARVCNGYWDCEEGEDEINCEILVTCHERNETIANMNGYKCRNKCSPLVGCRSPKKLCICDDECGWSCINPASECSDVPPSIENSVSYSGQRSLFGTKSSSFDKGPFILGDVIKYDCKEDMHLVGSLPRCNGRKQWSNETPSCISLSGCGRTKKIKIFENQRDFYRVVGGEDAEKNSWPWQILITLLGNTPEQTLSKNNLHGGGSLLNKKWVLTAAHLFPKAGSSPEWFRSFVISAGVYERPSGIDKIKKSVQMFTPSTGYIHKDFDPDTYENDIALLKIGGRYDLSMSIIPNNTKGVKYAFNVRPVCIPCTGVVDEELLVDDLGNSLINTKMPFSEKCDVENTFLTAENENVFVTGFGHVNKTYGRVTKNNINPPKYLQQAETKIGKNESCHIGIEGINRRLVNNPTLSYSDKLLCTISTSDSTDACQGDSGGPLVREIPFHNSDESVWVQVGIVSFGYGCGLEYPGFYTNVAHYLQWINETMEFDQFDPDCNFNDQSFPSCGYTDHENKWDRYGITENNGLSGYVSRARYEGSKLISPEIAVDWSSDQFICLKFDYYIHPFGSLAIESTWDFDDPSISWNTHENDLSHTWLDAILNIETTTSIKYQFNAINPTVYLDNVQIQKEKCVEHCSSIPCKNNGSCVNRMQTYTCFCTIDFEGSTCDIDIKCPRLQSTITNGNLAETSPLTQKLLLPNSTASYTCKPMYKMTGFSSAVNSKSTTCYRRHGRSYWKPDPSYQIKCIPITCINPPFQSNQHAVVEKTYWRVYESVEIECDDGYDFETSSTQTIFTCRNDERWHGTVTNCQEIECTSPQLRSHLILDNKTSKWKVNSVAIYRCNPGYKFSSGGETRNIRCESNKAWTSAIDDEECIKKDLDCKFDSTATPTCSYNNVGKAWKRQSIFGWNGFRGYAMKSTRSNSVLRSIEISLEWADDFICLHFYYKILTAESKGMLTIKRGFEGIMDWESPNNVKLHEWLDLYVQFNSADDLFFYFTAAQAGVFLDDVSLKAGKCENHCRNQTCRHEGSCVNRADQYTNCFCAEEYAGKNYQIVPISPHSSSDVVGNLRRNLSSLPDSKTSLGRSIDANSEQGQEIYFMFDVSDSVLKKYSNLKSEIEFAKRLVQRLEGFKGYVNYGIMVFASANVTILDITKSINSPPKTDVILRQLDEIFNDAVTRSYRKYVGSRTATACALEQLKKMLVIVREHKNNKRHIFIFTDGGHTEGANPVRTRIAIEAEFAPNIEFYSITACINCPPEAHQELVGLASKPENYIVIEDFYNLSGYLDQVTDVELDFTKCGKAGDVGSIRNQASLSLGRSVGGEDSKENAWPWHVLITKFAITPKKVLKNAGLVAGGSILNRQWILTAAHVLNNAAKYEGWMRSYVISVGVFERNDEDVGELHSTVQMYSFTEYIEHDQFSKTSYLNDIALIKLGPRYTDTMEDDMENVDGITYGYYVRPVCLPCKGTCITEDLLVDENDIPLVNPEMSFRQKCFEEEKLLLEEDSKVVSTGFGHTEVVEDGFVRLGKIVPPTKLQQALLQVESPATCRNGVEDINWEAGEEILQHSDKMFCCFSGDPRQIINNCKGDSGGPVVREVENLKTGETCWVQVGIVSFGWGCGVPDLPGFYTNVAKFVEWIDNNMTPVPVPAE